VASWLLVSAGAGLVANVVVVIALVGVNRGTIFAEAAAALVGFAITHLGDRIVLGRA
jgi:hypothetical protein